MNKRIYYFILPLLAILFSVVCTYNNAIPFPKNAPGLNVKEAAASHGPFSTDLRKGNKKVNIHAIRVKAKHDAVAAIIPTYQELAVHLVYNSKEYYPSYRACVRCAHPYRYNLRGPPSA